MTPTLDASLDATLDAGQFLDLLETRVAAGAPRALDLALTRFIHEQAPETDPAVLLAVALTSARNGHGHVCLDLGRVLEHPAAESAGLDALPTPGLSDWVARLARSPAVADRLTARDAPPELEPAPLVLAGTPERPLLYLRRYWNYETRIRAGIAARLAQPLALPETPLRELLGLLFDADPAGGDRWQKIACALAARNAFAIVTGGPGTGKTTTVVRLLALLLGLAMRDGGAPPRIRLAAPTGKAAARLNASIADRVASLPFARLPAGERLRAAIPTEAGTLHRLLGPRPDSRHFRHHAGHPLPVDILVVDEASMVDVEMMACVLDALRPDARLILLGDQDQLASVEAGAVLGDLCQRARQAHYTPETSDWLQRVTGERIDTPFQDPRGRTLDQAIVMLRRSYRFRAEGGIGALATLVNEGLVDGAPVADRLAAFRSLFDDARQTDPTLGRIRRIRLKDETDRAFDRLIRAGMDGYPRALRDDDPGDRTTDSAALADWARKVLAAQAEFQLLTPLREGPWGVEGLNRRIRAILAQAGALPDAADGRQWFHGRPVLVTRNDPALGLMNGDIGMTLRIPIRQPDGRVVRLPRVAFPAGDGTGGIRWIPPGRLQSVETVFAMTVHKSQGSEFTHTALILPDTVNPVLTRELLYTGITRARTTFTLLYSREPVLRAALEQRVERVSGMAPAG